MTELIHSNSARNLIDFLQEFRNLISSSFFGLGETIYYMPVVLYLSVATSQQSD